MEALINADPVVEPVETTCGPGPGSALDKFAGCAVSYAYPCAEAAGAGEPLDRAVVGGGAGQD
jgi:hypothetical protein